ncbi:MAG TPA: hypothetical protein VJ851_11325 [Jatrophihabitans sp.]|nr:hypothetical protein [Jatrophihabitans sp.]
MTLMYPVASVRPGLWPAGRTAVAVVAAVAIASSTAVAVSYADTGSAGTSNQFQGGQFGGQFPRGQFGGGQFPRGQFGGGQFGGPPGVGSQAGPLIGSVPGAP